MVLVASEVRLRPMLATATMSTGTDLGLPFVITWVADHDPGTLGTPAAVDSLKALRLIVHLARAQESWDARPP